MILGVGGAGKTCVLESLKTRFSPMPGLAPAQIVPTVGLNLARLEVPAARGGAETCVFWDLGGAPGLRGIWERYYAECDGVLFVVDAALSAENTAAENTDDGEDDRSKDAVTDEQLDEQLALLRRVLAEHLAHGFQEIHNRAQALLSFFFLGKRKITRSSSRSASGKSGKSGKTARADRSVGSVRVRRFESPRGSRRGASRTRSRRASARGFRSSWARENLSRARRKRGHASCDVP